MGTKKPFSGQASSQSRSPSFGQGAWRTSRYSPRSSRSISNSWPGLMLSCRRILAGRTIWPLLETQVVMPRKMPSYSETVNQLLPSSTRGRLSGDLRRLIRGAWPESEKK